MNLAELKSKTIRSTTWMYGANIINIALNMGVMIVLARLLSPSDFGLLGMIAVFTNFLFLCSEFGLSVAIIRSKEINDLVLNSCFWLFIYLGLGLSVLLIVFSIPISKFYNEQALIELILWMAPIFCLASVGELGKTLLQRNLRFSVIASVNITSQVIYGVIAITCAVMGFGAKSLVLGMLVSTLSNSILYSIYSGWRIKLPVSPKHAKEYLVFGSFVTAADLVNYLAANLDYLLIGRFLGSEPLGYYTLAYKLISLPLQKISRTIATTTFPALATIKDNLEQMKRGYNRISSVVAFVTFPLLTALFVTADPLITLFYGANWAPCIPVVQIMSLAGAIKCVGAIRGSIFVNSDRPDLSLYTQLIYLGLLAGGVTIGMPGGIVGVSLGVTVAVVISFLINQHLGNRLLQMKMRELLIVLRPAIIPSCLISVAGSVLSQFCRGFFPQQIEVDLNLPLIKHLALNLVWTDVLILGLQIISLAVLFIGFVLLFQRLYAIQIYQDLRGAFRKQK